MGVGLVAAGGALALRTGLACWTSKTLGIIERLGAAAPAIEPKSISFKAFDLLPAPVARYFRLVLRESQPLIRAARIQQQGEFWMNGKWIPFAARQYFSALPPGMVWDAEMRMNRFLNVHVRDAYVAGQGSMQARLLAFASVMNEQGNPKLNMGALQRYLAEAPWLPTALLPSESLKWSAVDEQRALAMFTDSGLIVSLDFRFNIAGEITGVFTPGRYREVGGEYELTPWAGYHRGYENTTACAFPSKAKWSGSRRSDRCLTAN
jgi:hypothetical protein